MTAATAFDATLAREIIGRWRSTPGAALPILHDLQHAFGYIDDEAIPLGVAWWVRVVEQELRLRD